MDPRCNICGLPIRENDRHNEQSVLADGAISIRCHIEDEHWRSMYGKVVPMPQPKRIYFSKLEE